MRDLPAIVALYREIDDNFADQWRTAKNDGDVLAAARIEAKQQLNDQAYYILCWGQLESAIDDKCRAAIRRRASSANWSVRRAWDLYNPDDRRLSGLSFEDRAALVLDKSGGPGSPWAIVMKHYNLRNQIAHGTLRPTVIDVEVVVQEFFQIQSALQP